MRASLGSKQVRAAEAIGTGLTYAEMDAAGQKIDFAQTQAKRLAAGDPRLSIEARTEGPQTL